MSRTRGEYTIWNGVTPVAVTSSTDATPIVVTATSHGFATGDLVMINGHTTNVAANGIFKVTVLTANTFQLKDRYSGASVAGSGAGAGSSGVVVVAPKIVSCADFTNVIFSVVTSGTATLTIKFAGSLGKPTATADGDTPNFGATAAASNPYQYVQLVNLDTAATVNGATGVALSGADTNTMYETNINAMKYLCPVLTAWTQGVITVKAFMTDNR